MVVRLCRIPGIFVLVLGLVVTIVGVSRASGPAAAATMAVNQCNVADNVGGQATACDVTVTNNLDLATGVTSSTVTVKECHGLANAALTCTTSTTSFTQLTTSVTQCDGSGNGGGSTVTCNVQLVNNITGVAPTSPATIDQQRIGRRWRHTADRGVQPDRQHHQCHHHPIGYPPVPWRHRL